MLLTIQQINKINNDKEIYQDFVNSHFEKKITTKVLVSKHKMYLNPISEFWISLDNQHEKFSLRSIFLFFAKFNNIIYSADYDILFFALKS